MVHWPREVEVNRSSEIDAKPATKLLTVRSQLYQPRFLRPNIRFGRFFRVLQNMHYAPLEVEIFQNVQNFNTTYEKFKI